MTLEHYLTPYIKINSKWIKDLNLRPDTIKLLEKNTLWHKSQQDPFGSLPRVVKRKTKINKQDLIKLKSFFMAKETRHKMKRQLSEREKTFALTFWTQLCGLLWPRGCKARLYMCLSVGYAPWLLPSLRRICPVDSTAETRRDVWGWPGSYLESRTKPCRAHARSAYPQTTHRYVNEKK